MQEVDKITIQDVISKRKQHTRRIDTKLIMKAYNFANEQHKDQVRRSRRALHYSSFKCSLYFSRYWS